MTEQAQKLRGSRITHTPDLPLALLCAGAPRAPLPVRKLKAGSSSIDFEMLISRLHPFMPSSPSDKANSVRREVAE